MAIITAFIICERRVQISPSDFNSSLTNRNPSSMSINLVSHCLQLTSVQITVISAQIRVRPVKTKSSGTKNPNSTASRKVCFLIFTNISLIGMSIAVLPICSDLAVFEASMTGACVAFLFHNRYKASVFMGATGALALGGVLATMAASTGMFFPLLISPGVIVLEALSILLQDKSLQEKKLQSGSITENAFAMGKIKRPLYEKHPMVKFSWTVTEETDPICPNLVCTINRKVNSFRKRKSGNAELSNLSLET